MKTKILLSGVGVIMLFALSCASLSRYALPGPTLRPSHIKGSWIGYDQDCLLFYRLTFADQGKGLCVVLYLPDGTYALYKNEWALKDDALGLQLTPANTGAEPMALKVKAVDQREMLLYANGLERDWSHRVLLHKEDDVLKHAKMSEKIARKAKW